MATATCIVTFPVDLPSGRLVLPGKSASDVDPAHPEVQAKVAAGLLRLDDIDVPSKVEDIVTWVGDDPGRATVALNAENARGSDARRTLVDKLTQLVDNHDKPQED